MTVSVAGAHLPNEEVDWTSAEGIRCVVDGRASTVTWNTEVDADDDFSPNRIVLRMLEVLDGLLAAMSLQIGSPATVLENSVEADFVLEDGRELQQGSSELSGRQIWSPLRGALYGALGDRMQGELLREVAYLLRGADQTFRAGGLTGCAALIDVAIEGLIAEAGIARPQSADAWRQLAAAIAYDERRMVHLYLSIQLARHWSATVSLDQLQELELRPLLPNDLLKRAREIVCYWLAARNPDAAATVAQIFAGDPTELDMTEGFAQRHPLGIRRETRGRDPWWPQEGGWPSGDQE